MSVVEASTAMWWRRWTVARRILLLVVVVTEIEAGGGGRSGSVDPTTSHGLPFAVGDTGGDRGAIVHGTPPGRGNNAKCGKNM